MKHTIQKQDDTEVVLNIALEKSDLDAIVDHVFDELRPKVKAAGFRPGKAPNTIVERELGTESVQAEVIEHAASEHYAKAVDKLDVRPLTRPKVDLKKFVPYSELEFTATVEVMPPVKLADYKKIKKTLPKVEVTDKEIDDVIEGLRSRAAKKTPVTRIAKSGDEATIDFNGERDGKKVPGADGKGYPLLLGSGRFIPGFEDEVIGMKPGQKKSFEITFPKDYAESTLQGKKVKFSVTLHKLNELALPKVDNEFAKSVGPFADLSALKADIKKQILNEKTTKERQALENEILGEIVDKSKLPLPARMVENQLEQLKADFERTLKSRNVTREEYLKQQKQSEKDLSNEFEKESERRVKLSLILTEIANVEKLEVTPSEFEIRMQLLQGQYQDPQMQAELGKLEARREIANQLLAEKTVAKLIEYATTSKS